VVGDQRHLGAAARDRRDVAGEAVAGDHGIADPDSVAGADVDRHVGEPDRRRAGDDPAGHRVVTGWDRPAFVQADQLAQLGVFGQRRLRADRPFARFFEFGVQAGVLALRVEGLVEPVDEIAGGLQRPVGDRLDRAEDRGDATLHAVGPLPVGDAQEGEGSDDQQRQHRAAAAYLLSIHVEVLFLGFRMSAD
jgi:hypothetical protein